MNTVQKKENKIPYPYVPTPKNIQFFIKPSEVIVLNDLISKDTLFIKNREEKQSYHTNTKKIAETSGQSIATVERALNTLRKLKIISTTHAPNGLLITINYNLITEISELSLKDAKAKAKELKKNIKTENNETPDIIEEVKEEIEEIEEPTQTPNKKVPSDKKLLEWYNNEVGYNPCPPSINEIRELYLELSA